MIGQEVDPVSIPTKSTLLLQATDAPDENGVNYIYNVSHKNTNSPGVSLHYFKFQKGDPAVKGTNGITDLVLLELLQHRFKKTNENAYNIITALIHEIENS